MRRLINSAVVTIGLIALCLILFYLWRMFSDVQDEFPVVNANEIRLEGSVSTNKSVSYVQWVRNADLTKYSADKAEVTVLATDYTAVSGEADIRKRVDPAKQAAVIDWNNAKGWVEWSVVVPQDGLYNLVIDYLPLAGSYSPIVRGIQIDGSYPYIEAERIHFNRYWQDSLRPYERNAIGNEIRPVQTEVSGWFSAAISDYSVSSEPLRLALTKGTHTIRLVGVKEPLALHSLTLTMPETIPTYAEYISRELNREVLTEWFEVFEAEQFVQKSAIKIRALSVAEPYVSPDPQGRVVYNAIGGNYWQNAGESVEWEISVPETGYYAIDLKYFQGYNGKASAYRTVMIDGQVPFQEMLHYRFAPNSALEIQPFADPDGNPYLFYLTKGDHRLQMIVDNSLIRPAILALNQLNERLTSIEREVRIISGNYGFGSSQNLDTARTWEMVKYDPDIESKLQSLIDDITVVRDYLNGLNQAVTDPTTALSIAINQLEDLLYNINELPNRVGVFQDIKSSINTWIKPIENQPIQLDYIVVRSPQTDPGLKLPGLWDKIQYTTVNFMRTFFQKYSTEELDDDDALTIWVQRGRDYVDLLQLMIEQDFTPATGIKVNLNLIPNQNVLLMGNAAGDQPDLALGVAMSTPVDFAMRGAAENLAQFPGFDEVAKRFNPGIMRSYTYDGQVFGLPETQNYNMLFYRTDIFEQLRIKPPDTWDDVQKLLPTLQENGMTFMFPKDNFMLPFYQHGADFYTADGLQPKLTDSEGLAAFKQWTDWFRKYDLPKDVPVFFNHFRYGDIPVGIGDMTTYVQLMVAAPELDGHWKMLPLPGIGQPDGTVVRWAPQATNPLGHEPIAAIMMSKSERKEEAWKFLQWWTSDEVQSRYSADIESFAGIEYRWYTANTAAFQTIPWTDEELSALNEQGRWTKNIPYVPGYYFLPRQMDFAWNDAVVGWKPAQEALEKAETALRREMERKQKEFGIEPGYDLQISPYDKPYNDLP